MPDFESIADKLFTEGQRRQGRDPFRKDFSAEPTIYFQGTRAPLHRGQVEAWESESNHVAVIAGSQAGKTVIGPHWVLREIQRCGGNDHLIVGPTFPLMDRKLVPECKQVWDSEYGLGEYKFGRRCFEFSPEGLRMIGVERACVFFGFAEDPESLESMTAWSCWRDETGQSKFSRAAAEAIARRLSIATKEGFGRILDTTTPYEAGGWFQEDVWDQREKLDRKILHVVSYRSEDNPAFPKDYVALQRAKGTPEWKIQMMYMGQYTRPAGAVYDCFEKDLHVVQRFPVPPDWKRYYGVDFGSVHTGVVCAAEHPEEKDSDGNPVLYIYHEHFPNKASYTYQHIKALKSAEEANDSEYLSLHPDFKGSKQRIRAMGGARSENDPRWEWTAAGIYVEEPMVSDVQTGIDRVYACLKRGGLKVMSNCVRTIADLEGYSWELDDNSEPIPGKLKDKAKFHLVDAARYLCAQLRPNKTEQPKLHRMLSFGAQSDVHEDEDDWGV